MNTLFRWLVGLGVLVVAFVVAAIWVAIPPSQLPAIYHADDCQQIAVIDPVTQQRLVGIEDLALSSGGQLLLSAYDRSAGDDFVGGIYSVSLFGLTGGGQVRATLLSNGEEQRVAFRPHGISLSRGGDRLAVINRFAPGEARIEVGDLTPDGWIVDRRISGERLCRANDLFLIGGRRDEMNITLDREDCTASMRDLKPGSTTGKLGFFDGTHFEISRVRLSFPNGVAGPYIAETREDRILRPGAAPIALPGAPDNMNLDDEDRLIVAVHPKLSQLFLYREGLVDIAPTRLLRVDTTTGGIDVLFDDPSGQVFSAATSAVFRDGILVAGSVQDHGLLVCRKAR